VSHIKLLHSVNGEVDRYLARFPWEKKRLAPLLVQLSKPDDPYDRRTHPGHITASAFAPCNGRLLFVYHPILAKWLLPGGHVERSETPVRAALREFHEETGMRAELADWQCRNRYPLDIDIHVIPSNPGKREPAHLHYDFRYWVRNCHATPRNNACRHAIQWRALSQRHEPNIAAVIAKLRSIGSA
jgi:8-oxo-dGTP pyrophosphatase MutT (NUDIX family)